MKSLIVILLCGVTVVSLAEDRFDRHKWHALAEKAEEKAKKEFSGEFIVQAPGWEPGKGMSFFVMDAHSGDFYMKFDSEGRLIKVAKEDDFPEIVKFNMRKEELRKQYQEEYAKSLGMTLEEAKKQSYSLGITLNERVKNEAEERADILPKIESLIGYKFGQPPIDGVDIKTNRYSRYDAAAESRQVVKLKKPYRYMKDATLTYADNKLIGVKLSVKFGDEYSVESIEMEFDEMKRDIEGKFGFVFPRSMLVGAITARHGKVEISVDKSVGNRDKGPSA